MMVQHHLVILLAVYIGLICNCVGKRLLYQTSHTNTDTDIAYFNPQYRCPQGHTFCPVGEKAYGCCPFSKGICCSDSHCCPYGTTCKSHQCQYEDSIFFTQTLFRLSNSPKQNTVDNAGERDNHRRESTINSTLNKLSKLDMQTKDLGNHKEVLSGPVMCPGGTDICPEGSTCCSNVQGKWSCCPAPSAVCCKDKQHCCPQGMTCDAASKKCIKPATLKGGLDVTKTEDIVSWMSHFEATSHTMNKSPLANAITCPDHIHQCSENSTCCLNKTGSWACCPSPNAVCCADHVHCCPQNYSCKQTVCSNGRTFIPFMNQVKCLKRKSGY